MLAKGLLPQAQNVVAVAVMNVDRLSFGFHNPYHAAALVCALLPLCLGWRGAGVALRIEETQP